jgi:hypothetical protein
MKSRLENQDLGRFAHRLLILALGSVTVCFAVGCREESGGGCTNEDDIAIIESIDIGIASSTCGASCALGNDPEGCTFTCLTDATGLSSECVDCHVGSVLCTVEACATPCTTPGNPECDACRESHCMQAFWDCSGLSSDR